MADNEVSVEITIEEKQALKALTQLTKGLQKTEKQAVESGKAMDKSMDSFVGNLAAIGASKAIGFITDQIGDFVAGSFEAAAATERINTQLEILTGSQETAARLFSELTEFSASTPFQLQGISEAAAQLISFGFESDTVTERLRRIGDVAAGSGTDLKEISLIYGQVAAAGKLTGERLLQLQERAIPIGPAIARTMGVAESSVKDLVSQGKITQEVFEEAFNAMSKDGGIFAGAIDKQSKTISGVMSTLNDNIFILQSNLGKLFGPAIISGATALTNVVGKLSDAIQLMGADDPVEKATIKLKALGDVIEDVKSTTDSVNSVLGEDSWLGRINRSRADERIKNIKEEMAELQTVLKDAGAEAAVDSIEDDTRVKKEVQVSQKILDERMKLEEKLAILKEEQDIKKQERLIAEGELEIEQRENAINEVAQHEQDKADIILKAQLERNKKIGDEETRLLANRVAQKQHEVNIEQSAANAKKRIREADLQHQQQMVAGFGVALNQAANLAQKGTAEQKALAIAASTINTYQAATRAFRDYPFPANVAVMATTIATGLKAVDTISRQSLFTGGVVGGFSGSSDGADNTTINARRGEMVLNGSQQRQLFDVASGRQGGDNSELMSAIMELANRPTVVEIEGREIARTVRDQQREGFNAA